MSLPRQALDTTTEGISGEDEKFLIYLQLQKSPE